MITTFVQACYIITTIYTVTVPCLMLGAIGDWLHVINITVDSHIMLLLINIIGSRAGKCRRARDSL